jgi:hypothetical protein
VYRTEGFLHLEPECSQIRRFREPIAGQRLNLRQYSLPLLRREVGGKGVDVAWWCDLYWWRLYYLRVQLPPCTLMHGLQRFRPAGLQLRNSSVHRHGPQLELTAVRHNAFQYVHPCLMGGPDLFRCKHGGVG